MSLCSWIVIMSWRVFSQLEMRPSSNAPSPVESWEAPPTSSFPGFSEPPWEAPWGRKSAFYGCSSLTSITIPPSVTEIRRRTFRGCTSLTEVRIPNGCNVDEDAFKDCPKVQIIRYWPSETYLPHYQTPLKFAPKWGIFLPRKFNGIGILYLHSLLGVSK